jgi:hypothetical protein
MEHPNKDILYCLSYPRSGSSWFRYCFGFITETNTDKPGLLCHSHWHTDEDYKINNCFDIKNILILRNYKECIFSELKNIISRNPVALYTHPIEYVWHHTKGCDSTRAEGVMNSPVPKTEQGVAQVFADLKIDQHVNDFLLPNMPTLANHIVSSKHCFGYEQDISCSFICHFHFALQLKRYYELLEYHDKISKTNPNKALLIRYEDFIQNSPLELDKMIDFMKNNNLLSPKTTRLYRDKLTELNNNIEYHKNLSIKKYRAQRHLGSSFNKNSFHSSEYRKEFLVEIDNVLKNKNLELFNKYLSDYEEKD